MKRMLKFCFAWLLGLGLASAWAQKGMDQININGQFLLAARAGQVSARPRCWERAPRSIRETATATRR